MDGNQWNAMIENPNRVKILEFFSKNPRSESTGITTQELSDKLDIPESTLSINLIELLNIGVLKSRKEGKYKYYWMDEALAKEIADSFKLMREAYTKLISKK